MMTVSLAWNKDNGEVGHKLYAIDVTDNETREVLATLSCLEGVRCALHETQSGFSLRRQNFPIKGYARWVGSMAWDAVQMEEEHVIDFIAYALQTGFSADEWLCDGPLSHLFNRVQHG
jgi:hypothetical protein